VPLREESVVPKAHVPQETPVVEMVDVHRLAAYAVPVEDVPPDIHVVERMDVYQMMGACVVRGVVVIVPSGLSVVGGINVV